MKGWCIQDFIITSEDVKDTWVPSSPLIMMFSRQDGKNHLITDSFTLLGSVYEDLEDFQGGFCSKEVELMFYVMLEHVVQQVRNYW